MTEELKPCPCCNSDARLHTEKGKAGKVCISSWFRQYAYCKNKKCGLRTTVFKRPNLATTAWNTRHGENE